MTEKSKKKPIVKQDKKPIKQKQKQSQKQVVNVNINPEKKTTTRKRKTSSKKKPTQNIPYMISPEQNMRIFQTFTPPQPPLYTPSNDDVLNSIQGMMSKFSNPQVVQSVGTRSNETLQSGIQNITNEIQETNKISDIQKSKVPLNPMTGQPRQPRPNIPVKLEPEKNELVKIKTQEMWNTDTQQAIKQAEKKKTSSQSFVLGTPTTKSHLFNPTTPTKEELEEARVKLLSNGLKSTLVFGDPRGGPPLELNSAQKQDIDELTKNLSNISLVYGKAGTLENTLEKTETETPKKRGRKVGSTNRTSEHKEADVNTKNFSRSMLNRDGTMKSPETLKMEEEVIEMAEMNRKAEVIQKAEDAKNQRAKTRQNTSTSVKNVRFKGVLKSP